MNQSDFRALLSSSSSTAGGNGSGSGGSRSGGFGGKRQLTEADLAEVRRLSKAKKPKKKGGRKPDGDSAASSSSSSSAYRDRAAERRQGGASDMADAAEFAHLDAAQSKFLGGDVAHTHLVKGLDFALLAQLKREREALLQATVAAKQQQQQRQLSSGGLTSKQPPQQQVAFTTRLGRLVYFHAVQSSAAARGGGPPTEHFLPGRMHYTFDLSAATPESVPVVVQRSKEDCPEPDDIVSGMVSALVISRVGDVLRAKRHGGSKKLRRKKPQVEDGARVADPASDDDGDAAASTLISAGDAAADSEDEDIFPDAGEYVPVHARAEEEAEDEAKSSRGREPRAAGYFSDLSASLSAAARAERTREAEAERAWRQTLRKVVATQSAAEREQKVRERAAQVDEYSECFPEYQAAASALDSEDDEEQPRKRKDDGDAAEDAAAEKTRRRKQKAGNKLQSDLEKITKMMDEKTTKPQ